MKNIEFIKNHFRAIILSCLGFFLVLSFILLTRAHGEGGISGNGLTASSSSEGITVGIADFGITTEKLASGSVTPDKISNGSSEPSRIYTWGDDDDHSVSALNTVPNLTIPTTISVTVPTGKAYNYIVNYDGIFHYSYSERNSSNTSFYAGWEAALLANDTQVSSFSSTVVQTGYRMDWSALGGSSYWRFPYHVSWLVRLAEGTHTLKLYLYNGFSDNTMTYAHFLRQRVTAIRVF